MDYFTGLFSTIKQLIRCLQQCSGITLENTCHCLWPTLCKYWKRSFLLLVRTNPHLSLPYTQSLFIPLFFHFREFTGVIISDSS